MSTVHWLRHGCRIWRRSRKGRARMLHSRKRSGHRCAHNSRTVIRSAGRDSRVLQLLPPLQFFWRSAAAALVDEPLFISAARRPSQERDSSVRIPDGVSSFSLLRPRAKSTCSRENRRRRGNKPLQALMAMTSLRKRGVMFVPTMAVAAERLAAPRVRNAIPVRDQLRLQLQAKAGFSTFRAKNGRCCCGFSAQSPVWKPPKAANAHSNAVRRRRG
jgi:hypothetical protein